MRLEHFFTLVAFAALSATSATAQPPQWSVAFDTSSYADESPLPDLRASWAPTADGGHVLASLDDADAGRMLVRRFNADGSVRYTRPWNISLPNPRVLLAADGSAGTYVVSSSPATPGASAFGQIIYLEADGSFGWYRSLTDPTTDTGVATALERLAGGDLLLLRERRLQRLDGQDGAQVWAFAHVNEPFQDANDLSVAGNTAWIAGRLYTPTHTDGVGYVLKVDANTGTRINAWLPTCSTCTQGRALGIDVQPSGRVVAVGRGGTGEPGFVAFFAPEGVLQFVADVPDGGYDRVTHDSVGNVYALSRATNTVSAIDPANGTARWTKPGSDMVATASGIIISRVFPVATGAIGVDMFTPSGNPVWSRELETADGVVAGGARHGGGITTLLTQVERAPGIACGVMPRLVRLNANGQPINSVGACTTERPRKAAPRGHSADAAAGVIANVDTRMVALTPTGARRWTFDVCPGCMLSVPGPRTLASALQPDGSAWLLTESSGGAARAVVRVGADGTALSTTPVLANLPAGPREYVLLGDANRAIALAASGGAVDWARVSSAGALLDSRSHALPVARERSAIRRATPLADGGLGFDVVQTTPAGCQPSPPVNCFPPRTTALRLNVDGTERWRVDLGEQLLQRAPFVGFDGDGSAIVMTVPANDDITIATIAADGSLGAAAPVAGTVSVWSDAIAGPVNGRYFLMLTSPPELRLIDRTGAMLASAPLSPFSQGPLLASGDHGFIVNDGANDGVLRSPVDLAELAHFNVDDGSGEVDYRDTYWQMLPDGSVYTTTNSASHASMSRFSVPGSPAHDGIFGDGFDAP